MSKQTPYFDPQTNKYPYTELTDKHYLHVKKNNGLVFDENYPYIDNSKSFRFVDFWVRVLLYLFIFLLAHIRMGLRIKGRKNLKKHKEEIKKGVISICNHVHMWDYIGVMCAIRPHKPKLLAWANNIRGENSFLIRHVGGIPVPDDNMKGTMAYFDAIKKLLNSGGWLHLYPEGSMWEYYAPIRPFKRGAAFFACAYNKPILPLAYSYRRPNWIRRKIFHQIACFTLTIGEPVYPNEELSIKEREVDLINRAHAAMCELARINPEENIYESLYNNSKRIDYYTTEYGVDYKGSR